MSSVHVGAQLRTAFVLSRVLQAKGEIERAQELRQDTMHQLGKAMGEDIGSMEIDETFFDQFVLFCHR